MGTRRVLPDSVKKFLIDFLKNNPHGRQASYGEYTDAAKEAGQTDIVVESTFCRWRGDRTVHSRRPRTAPLPAATPAVASPESPSKRPYRRSGGLYFKAWQTEKVDQFPVELIRDMLDTILRNTTESFEIIEISKPKRMIEVRSAVKN